MAAITRERYLEMIEQYAKDLPEVNILIDNKKENTPLDYELYLDMAENFLGTVPPFIPTPGIYEEGFPFVTLVIHRAIIEMLISNLILDSRNDLSYNNGGISVKAFDPVRHSTPLGSLLTLFGNEVEQLANWKVSLNLELGFGGVSSPYSNLTTRW